jgi:hypothetical protein
VSVESLYAGGVDPVSYGPNSGGNFVNFCRWWNSNTIKVFPLHVLTHFELIFIDVFSWLLLESVSAITFVSSKIIIIIIIITIITIIIIIKVQFFYYSRFYYIQKREMPLSALLS